MVVALHFSIQALQLSKETETPLNLHHISGSIAELKVHQLDSFAAAVNETFYNMFGDAVKLILNALSK